MPGYRIPPIPGSAGLTRVSGRTGSSSDGSSSDSPVAGEFSRDMQYITTRIPAGGAGGPGPARAAVVVNPTKHDDAGDHRDMIRAAMSAHGWSEPLWLETTAQETGRGLARRAVADGVQLVLASGGDGTVTACAAGLAGSGVPLGVLPAGTGNLLARNLSLPLDLEDALIAALTGTDRELDVGTANGTSFVVMAGMGLDAKMLDDASEPLKKRLGWAAYTVSLLRHLPDRPMRVSLIADGGRPLRRRASGVIVGNVGFLQGGVPLLPRAQPDDGLLDAVVLAARGVTGWLAVAADVLLRRHQTGRVTHVAFRDLRISLDRDQPWQLDGEVMGRTRELVIALHPGKVLLRVPAGEA
jgi:diacylglycerol kinase (ATP)